MEVEWAPARSSAARAVWDDILRPIARELEQAAPELAARAVAHMRSELPDQFPDADFVEENRASTQASLERLAQVIEAGGDPRTVELSPLTVAVARSGVHRQVGIEPLLRFYRLGQEQVWQWLFQRIVASARDATEQALAVDLATGWLFAYSDGAMSQAVDAYEAERSVWLRGAAAARSAAIEEILSGREHDERRASAKLRYEVGRHHLGILAWFETAPPDGDAHPGLDTALAQVTVVLEADHAIVQPVGTLAVAAWVSSRRPFTAERVAALTEAGPGLVLPDDVRLAVGGPGHGLAGFRGTAVEAAHARRVASLIGATGPRVTSFGTVSVAALGTIDPGLAVTFVERVLGPLADDDETTSRVASTLAVFLEENRSRSRAGKRLTIHPNTVNYRVRQAEEILGRSIEVDTLDLQVALALLPALPGLRAR